MSDADEGEDSLAATDVRLPLLRVILDHVPGKLHLLGLGIFLSVVQNVAQRAPPILIGWLFDMVLSDTREFAIPPVPAAMLPTTERGQLWFVLGLFGCAFFGAQVIRMASTLTWSAFAYRLQHELRVRTYDTAQRLQTGFFDDRQTGEIMSVLNNDVNRMEGFFSDTIGSGVNKAGGLLVIAVYMFSLNWQFALVPLLTVPVIGYLIHSYYHRMMEIYAEVRRVAGELNAQLQNSISGVSVVKSHTAEDVERDRVEDVSREYYRTHVDAIDTRSVYQPLVNGLKGLSVGLTFAVGGYWVLVEPPGPATAPLTVGMLVTFLLYAWKLPFLMQQMMGSVDSYTNARASAQRILGLQGKPVRSDPAEEGASPEHVDGRIEYDDVTFTYPHGEEPAVESVSFEVEPGETVGVVGPTGAGKSTLVKLLLRLYDVEEGEIRIDGRDLRAYGLSSLRDHVGYINQEPFLFSGTVGENVTYGLAGADEAEVWRALRLAGAAEFVEEMPDGLATEIGERGVTLSGGQRQRLCLARAIIPDPSILVLDEATSHVDTETEALIQRGIRSIVEDRTTLVIAHRLSTVRDADRIVVMEDGRVAETGSHQELLAADGLYANLWRVQAGNVQSLPETFLERVRERTGSGSLE